VGNQAPATPATQAPQAKTEQTAPTAQPAAQSSAAEATSPATAQGTAPGTSPISATADRGVSVSDAAPALAAPASVNTLAAEPKPEITATPGPGGISGSTAALGVAGIGAGAAGLATAFLAAREKGDDAAATNVSPLWCADPISGSAVSHAHTNNQILEEAKAKGIDVSSITNLSTTSNLNTESLSGTSAPVGAVSQHQQIVDGMTTDDSKAPTGRSSAGT